VVNGSILLTLGKTLETVNTEQDSWVFTGSLCSLASDEDILLREDSDRSGGAGGGSNIIVSI
jgi:hypothetical protein